MSDIADNLMQQAKMAFSRGEWQKAIDLSISAVEAEFKEKDAEIERLRSKLAEYEEKCASMERICHDKLTGSLYPKEET